MWLFFHIFLVTLAQGHVRTVQDTWGHSKCPWVSGSVPACWVSRSVMKCPASNWLHALWAAKFVLFGGLVMQMMQIFWGRDAGDAYAFGRESLPRSLKWSMKWVLLDVAESCYIIVWWWRTLSLGKVIAKLLWTGLGGKEGGWGLWSKVSYDASGLLCCLYVCCEGRALLSWPECFFFWTR